MGYSVVECKFQTEAAAEANAERSKLAGKIVMAITDRIVGEIIRPGPKPEERECYEMARELRAIAPALTELTAAVLKVADEEGI